MPSHVQIIVLFVVMDYLLILGKWLAQLMGLCITLKRIFLVIMVGYKRLMLVAMTNIAVKLFILGIVGKNTFTQVKQQQSIHKSGIGVIKQMTSP